jgi:hypothetical protein
LNQQNDFCDISYDTEIEKLEGINRLPWVGTSYREQEVKILVLGESVYDWNPKDPESIGKISSPYNLRSLHKNHALNFNRKSKFVRNIERAIYGKRKPSDDEKNVFWSSVSYHNLVSRVLKSKKHRPSYSDYYSGWGIFDKLIDTLEIDEVIVYGLEQKKIKSLVEYSERNGLSLERAKLPEKVGRSFPRRITIKRGAKEVKLLFIRHPSSYFSWEKWSPIINNEIHFPGTVV